MAAGAAHAMRRPRSRSRPMSQPPAFKIEGEIATTARGGDANLGATPRHAPARGRMGRDYAKSSTPPPPQPPSTIHGTSADVSSTPPNDVRCESPGWSHFKRSVHACWAESMKRNSYDDAFDLPVASSTSMSDPASSSSTTLPVVSATLSLTRSSQTSKADQFHRAADDCVTSRSRLPPSPSPEPSRAASSSRRRSHIEPYRVGEREKCYLSAQEIFWTNCRQNEFERCGSCSKDDFWFYFDTFADMDRRGVDSIRRSDFLWGLGAHGARASFNKGIRKTSLCDHFHSTAEDLSLENFIRIFAPHASESDMELMLRWSRFRKAYRAVVNENFKGMREELVAIFENLCDPGYYVVGSMEIVRSRLLTIEELRAAVPDGDSWIPKPFSFDSFSDVLGPVLIDKYVGSQEHHEDKKLEWRVVKTPRPHGLPKLPTTPSRQTGLLAAGGA